MQTPSEIAPAHFHEPLPSQALYRLLHKLPFRQFARLVARLLEQMGYQEVRLMGATHVRGRNAYGGLDLQAVLETDLTRALVIAQVKQYRRPVPRSFVDELRGTMLRLGAQQGLLITTSTFAPAASEAAASGQHSLPVRLIDGKELVRLLQKHDIRLAEGQEPAELSVRSAASWAQPPDPHFSAGKILVAESGVCGEQPPRGKTKLVPSPVPPQKDQRVIVTVTLVPGTADSQGKGACR